jgi:hypothetical protein
MLGLLRRHQPPNVLLGVAYWAAIVAVVMAGVLLLFVFAERLLPGGGQF